MSEEIISRLREALQAAQLQLEYLDERFPTGTTPPIIAKLERALRESLDHTEEDAREWIPWPGGDCPVPSGTLVDVKWNNGAVSRDMPAGLYTGGDLDLWKSRGHGGHVVAYRLAA